MPKYILGTGSKKKWLAINVRSRESTESPDQETGLIVAKILNYLDCDAILQKARAGTSLAAENAKIMFFPDVTLAVQRQ